MNLQEKIIDYLEKFNGTIRCQRLHQLLLEDICCDSKHIQKTQYQLELEIAMSIDTAIKNKIISIKLYEEYTEQEKIEDDVYYKLL